MTARPKKPRDSGRKSSAEALEDRLSNRREQEIAQRVKDLVRPACEAEGLELIHVEYRREPVGRVLRVYLDKPGGITLGDCSQVSRQVSDLLDVALDVAEPYSLEVTSPGPNRPLGEKEDFDRFVGQWAKVRVARPIEGQKNFTGVLKGTAGDAVRLEAGEKTVDIPFELITRARLVESSGES
ncbi:MAG: ribosome maturation factor RimP [Desulfobacterales bacterium]